MNTDDRRASTVVADARHNYVCLIGGNGPHAPGWYLEHTQDARIGLCVGPYDTLAHLQHDYERSRLRYPMWGFVAESALVMTQIVALRTSNIYVGAHSRIDDLTKLEGGEGIVIGAHVHIASFCHINIGGGLTLIGDGAAFSSGAKIHSGSNLPDAPSMSATAPKERQTVVRRYTVIGKDAAVLSGAQVLSGLVIGEGARVGAGAVVCDDVPPFELWVGGKARATRDMRTGARLDGGRDTRTHVGVDGGQS